MATYKELVGAPLDAKRKAVNFMLQEAGKELGANNLTLRSLLPQDLNTSDTAFRYSVTVTSTTANIVNAQTISNDRWVSIYGISYPSATPIIQELQVTGKGQTLRIWNIEDIPNYQDNVGYFDDVVVLFPNTTITLQARNATTTTNASENIIFLGDVVERKGLRTSN